MKISPDGRKLAVASSTNSTPSSWGNGGFFLFDFDPSSGIVSNSLTLISGLNLPGTAYGLEFSSDGTKLYGSTEQGQNHLYQWDICAGTNSSIINSVYSQTIGAAIVGSLQRGIDNKIYLAVSGQPSLGVIHNPNAQGAAMNFVINGISIAPKYSTLGLPNFINPYAKPVVPPFTNTVTCHSVNFSVPPVPSYSNGCSPVSYAPSGYYMGFWRSFNRGSQLFYPESPQSFVFQYWYLHRITHPPGTLCQ